MAVPLMPTAEPLSSCPARLRRFEVAPLSYMFLTEPEVKFVDGDVFLFRVSVLPALRSVLAPRPFLGAISSDKLLCMLSIQLVGLFGPGPGLLLRECILANVESNSNDRNQGLDQTKVLLTATALLVW